MIKIYLVQGSLKGLKILEVELIKITPEQIRIDNKSTKVVWSGGATNYIPYLSSRLHRRSITYFTTLALAIDAAIASTQKDLARAAENVHAANLQIAELAILLQNQEEEKDAA